MDAEQKTETAMHSLSFLLAPLLILAGQSAPPTKSFQTATHFTLQVASFPDTAQANRFGVGLVGAGESPMFDTVEIEGRGYWTRVFVGVFDTPDSARRCGVTLVNRGLIKEFLVKRAALGQSVTRPRRVAASDSLGPPSTGNSQLATKVVLAGRGELGSRGNPGSGVRLDAVSNVNGRQLAQGVFRDPVRKALPVVRAVAFRLAPRIDSGLIPRPDPVGLAFKLVTGEARNGQGAPGQQGGLWVRGDTGEGLARLRWIVGEENAGLINLDADGGVRFDMILLAQLAGRGATRVQDPLQVVKYVSSNEGLLLLVQVAQGRSRYLLHVGREVPTFGKNSETPGSINLDNNVDSRINRYRKNGKKLDRERPPEGFDSLIGLNPAARWFNLNANCWVQGGEIVFHEIAEAYGKLELGLDYLDQGSRPGAHGLALVREQRLKSQRPSAGIVTTNGSNRLLRSQEEIRLFTAEAVAGVSQR
jgi:SPOR domain